MADFLERKLSEKGLSRYAVAAIASAELKKDEEGLIACAKEWDVPFLTFPVDELKQVRGEFTDSDFVEETTGVGNICERAVAAAGASRLVLKKVSENGMTLAVGLKEVELYVR